MLFWHASPRRDDEMLTRLSPPERWMDALEGVDTGLIVAGHTHQQDDRVVGNLRFVNAGSVGLPYEGDGAAHWLWVVDHVPELRHTAYDAARAGARILASGWPDERSVRAALVEPVEAITVTGSSRASPPAKGGRLRYWRKGLRAKRLRVRGST